MADTAMAERSRSLEGHALDCVREFRSVPVQPLLVDRRIFRSWDEPFEEGVQGTVPVLLAET